MVGGGGGGEDAILVTCAPYAMVDAPNHGANCLTADPGRPVPVYRASKNQLHPNDLDAKPRRASLCEALHVRHVERIRQACISKWTKPTQLKNCTYQWTACNSREIHAYPLEADTRERPARSRPGS